MLRNEASTHSLWRLLLDVSQAQHDTLLFGGGMRSHDEIDRHIKSQFKERLCQEKH